MRNKNVIYSLFVFFVINFFFAVNANGIDNTYVQNPYFATSSKYAHIYANPPRQSLGAHGVYVFLNKKTRYIHSSSKLKGAKHAARINAYNFEAYN